MHGKATEAKVLLGVGWILDVAIRAVSFFVLESIGRHGQKFYSILEILIDMRSCEGSQWTRRGERFVRAPATAIPSTTILTASTFSVRIGNDPFESAILVLERAHLGDVTDLEATGWLER